jgi:carbon storage regulator
MLIITRKVDEHIIIGDGVRITVVAIRGRQVRIGIQAPRQMSVRRDDLRQQPAPSPGPAARA